MSEDCTAASIVEGMVCVILFERFNLDDFHERLFCCHDFVGEGHSLPQALLLLFSHILSLFNHIANSVLSLMLRLVHASKSGTFLHHIHFSLDKSGFSRPLISFFDQQFALLLTLFLSLHLC